MIELSIGFAGLLLCISGLSVSMKKAVFPFFYILEHLVSFTIN